MLGLLSRDVSFYLKEFLLWGAFSIIMEFSVSNFGLYFSVNCAVVPPVICLPVDPVWSVAGLPVDPVW